MKNIEIRHRKLDSVLTVFILMSFAEVLVDLREGILQIGRHFQLADSRLTHISLTPDYSMQSHAQDHEVYAGVMRSKKRRAKALLDFERHDDDELGFRKNDIITVISQKVLQTLSHSSSSI